MLNLLKQLDKACKDDVKQARWRAHVAICESKQRFATKAKAKRKCELAISYGADPTIRPYFCNVCHQYHLTRN